MRLPYVVAAVLVSLPLFGCGDNLKPASDVDASTDAPLIDAPPIDAEIDAPIDAAVDAMVCPPPATGQVGGPCTGDAMCDSAAGAGDGFCLRGAQGTVVWPDAGFCVNQVGTCTAGSCGAGNQCTTINDPVDGAFDACLPACAASACACPDGQACATSFVGSAFGAGQTACLPGDVAAVDGAACSNFGDCAQDSLCQGPSAEVPNGACGRLGCTIGDDTTCAAAGDGHCVNLAAITSGLNSGTLCVDACTVDSDCRQAEGYKCFDAGGTVGKFCRHPQVGDACLLATDCGDPATWTCNLALAGGTCTLLAACPTPGSSSGCPLFSTACWDGPTPAPVDNSCVDRCGGPVNTQGGCRAGLVCRDVNPGAAVTLGCIAP
ncbi:MAG: hypothetical protein R3B06_03940 [Kofleriaceae bacterium]